MKQVSVISMHSKWQFLTGILALMVLLYLGQALFVPMSYGLLIAIVLYPLCLRLEKKGWVRSMSITAGLLAVIILFLALIGLLVVQAAVFLKDMPDLLTKLKPAISELQRFAESTYKVSPSGENGWWNQVGNSIHEKAGGLLAGILTHISRNAVSFFLAPVYAALFLYNRQAFVAFLRKIVPVRYRPQLPAILYQVIHTYYHFILGMIKVYLIVGILNSIGLLALGIRHAILFGMLTAIMTIIPYIGIIVSGLLPVSVALITKNSVWYPIGVIAVFAVVQYLEANIIFPRVVAAQLKVSTWATLVAIITGGILWGISGMILFIPFIGIAMIILENIPDWEALKILLKR